MRTSETARIAPLVLSVGLLAGCIGGGGTGGAPAQAVVTSDAVVVTGPHGFCVDETATRTEGDTAFVLLGNCAAISNAPRADQPAVPVVLTAAISDASDAGSIRESIADLDSYFRSEAGRALLSRTQEASTVSVLDSRTEGETFLLHASDVSAGALEGVQTDYWRAYFDLGSRIATLSVYALQERGVTQDQTLAVLREFAATMRAANLGGGGGTADAQTAAAPGTTVAAAPQGPLFNVGFFRRIFD